MHGLVSKVVGRRSAGPGPRGVAVMQPVPPGSSHLGSASIKETGFPLGCLIRSPGTLGTYQDLAEVFVRDVGQLGAVELGDHELQRVYVC